MLINCSWPWQNPVQWKILSSTSGIKSYWAFLQWFHSNRYENKLLFCLKLCKKKRRGKNHCVQKRSYHPNIGTSKIASWYLIVSFKCVQDMTPLPLPQHLNMSGFCKPPRGFCRTFLMAFQQKNAINLRCAEGHMVTPVVYESANLCKMKII